MYQYDDFIMCPKHFALWYECTTPEGAEKKLRMVAETRGINVDNPDSYDHRYFPKRYEGNAICDHCKVAIPYGDEASKCFSGYQFCDEISNKYEMAYGESHTLIIAALNGVISRNGDSVILDREPLERGGRVIGEWVWVSPETADVIRESIAATQNLS